MKARRGQSENYIAGSSPVAVKQPVPFHRADGEAGQIVMAGIVEARHFRCLAADQRAPGLNAAIGDACD